MSEAEFRFYEELNDHLPESRRKRSFVHRFSGRTPVAELIQTFGVPLTEVDLILVNGESVAADHLVSDGDRVSIYPVFEAFDITQLVKLRPEPLRRVRFMVDTDLNQLGRLLQSQGFDTLSVDESLQSTVPTTDGDERILLTRQPSRLQRHGVTHGLLIRADDPQEQLEEVMHRLHLTAGRANRKGE